MKKPDIKFRIIISLCYLYQVEALILPRFFGICIRSGILVSVSVLQVEVIHQANNINWCNCLCSETVLEFALLFTFFTVYCQLATVVTHHFTLVCEGLVTLSDKKLSNCQYRTFATANLMD